MGTCLLNRKAGDKIRKEKMAGSEKNKDLKKIFTKNFFHDESQTDWEKSLQ